ncbi:metallophosphoesterase [Halalkalibacter urbisdiaboli]|uniref:metallophosphoesterase n=1 Tax=Halalkalibacter urbisdiaboli TaxID=1960589 RepID=UPI000B444308|nr:metallophosphoesterase [Halalkalibacter urbisdiaboli]
MKLIVFFVVGIGSLLLLYMLIEAHRNRIRHQELEVKNLPELFDGFRIYFISDVHRRRISDKMLKKIVKNCDLIIIGGDLLEKRVPIQRVEDNVKKLVEIAPTFFIWGNNDIEIDGTKLRACFKRNGVVELNDRLIEIERDSSSLAFVGVHHERFRSCHLQLYEKAGHYDCCILLSHYPEVIDYLPIQHPFSLILSGHTHGGQIRLLGWGLAEKGGIKCRKGLVQLISNGYGTTGLPLRLGAPAETHLLTLRKKPT